MEKSESAVKYEKFIKRKKRLRTLRIVLIVLAVFVLYSMAETSNPITNRVTFESPQIPPAFDGYRIVFVADIHYGTFLNKQQLDAMVDRIDREDADLVLLGGDYIRHDPKGYANVEKAFKNIHAKDGVYGVYGNHELLYAPEEAVKCFADDKIGDLENTSVRINKGGESIVLSGAAEAQFGYPDVGKALNGMAESDFNIFVTHNPLLFANGAQNNYIKYMDLALMGHTHGGQLSFFGLYGVWSDEFAELYRPTVHEKGGLKYIITNGYGTSVIPLRFFVPPQMHVITLRRG